MLIPHLTNAFDQRFMGGTATKRGLGEYNKKQKSYSRPTSVSFPFFPSQPQLNFNVRIFCTGIETHGVIMSQLNHDLGNLDVSREVKMWS